MIQQHFLQQQRLNYNHDRLLERYHRLLPPKITEFRTFGASVLPGRNYEKHLDEIHGRDGRRSSLVEQSRAGIGRSNDTYRWMGGRASENLPRNISSVVQHSRSQSVPLVHAEKFEPVQVYDHPMYGPTPAYIRPVFNNQEMNDSHSEKAESDVDDDDDVRSHVSVDRTSVPEKKPEPVKDHDDSKKGPLGYISHKKWKAKYANLIPVDPLLFNIYTKRPNGSIHKYGQSLYAPPRRHRPTNLDDDIVTPTASEVESVRSETPQETSLPSYRRYNHLQQQRTPSALVPRPLEPIQTENESSDDEASPPDSPVPYLSRNKPNPFSSTPVSTTIPPVIPRASTPPIVETTVNSTLNTTPAPLISTASSTIPPAPPFPPSLATTTSSANRYETPSSLPLNSPPPAPPMPPSLAVSNSTATYQAPSTSSNLGPGTKAVSFVGASSAPVGDNDVSSSSDSDDEEKQKRRRRKKRLAAGGGDANSSSSDD